MTQSLAHSATAAFRILLLDIFEQILKNKGRIFDCTGIGHHSVPHCLVDGLDLVHSAHRSSSQNLIIAFSDIVGNEFHLCQVSDNMHIVPTFGDSCEGQRVVELSGPEERNVIYWELLSIHIHACY